MKTIALVIGASEHKDRDFHPLPGAAHDAARFSHALQSWGLPQEWIYHISKENATKAQIIKAFYDFRSEFDTESKLLIYFAGHGSRQHEAGSNNLESALILQDTQSSDVLGTGLRLVELMQLIRSLKPLQTFLFIDACQLRLNSLVNPSNDTEIFSTTNSKGFFCLFSSGVLSSYEDKAEGGGYFTSALIHSIGELRLTKQPSCQDISKRVEEALCLKGLPTPEAYHLGASQMWPLETSYNEVRPVFVKENPSLVERWEALAVLQNLLSVNKSPIIWMWGEGGLGKTILAEQLQARVAGAIYATVSNVQSQSAIVEQVRSQKSDLFFNRAPDKALYTALRHVQEHEPDCLFIVDHLDRLEPKHVQELIAHIESTSLPCLLISRHRCPRISFKVRAADLIEWKAATFTTDETEELIQKNGLKNSLASAIFDSTCGNALKTRQMLVQLSGQATLLTGKMNQESIVCMSAVVACGGFLDENIFCHTYRIRPSSVDMLVQLGLIRYSKDGCFAHDMLEELVEENKWPLDIVKASSYWNRQVQHTPFNRFACRSLVLLASHLENCRGLKSSLGRALETLNEREYRSFILDLALIFRKYDWKELLLAATDALVDHEDYMRAGELLDELIQSGRPEVRHHAVKNAIRRCLWIGKFKDVLELYASVLGSCKSKNLLISMRNNVGVALFFLGRFDEAIPLYEKNLSYVTVDDEREIGVAKYMLGLIYTYKNEQLELAKTLLETSILIFESSKYYHWLIVAVNGLSVLYNITNQRERALFHLAKAYEIATALQNKTFLLQTLKNTARVQLRHLGPFSEEIQCTVEALERNLKEVLQVGHNWATMWAENILCTVYAHRHQPEKMAPLLADVVELTKNYDECNIFTLSNQGHYAALTGRHDQAKLYYKQAYQLCKKASIPLIYNEIRQDFLDCGFPSELQDSCLEY